MAQKYFAMDFAFYSTMGVYSFRDCCEITRATGYDAMLLSIWDGRNWAQATEMETMKSRHGVEPAVEADENYEDCEEDQDAVAKRGLRHTEPLEGPLGHEADAVLGVHVPVVGN